MTGSGESEASIPGRCAAPPAPAMITLIPRSAASEPKATISRGMRWADRTSASNGTPKSSSAAAAACITGQSESLPMQMATSGLSLIDDSREVVGRVPAACQ